MDVDKTYTHAQLTARLREIAAAHPDLIALRPLVQTAGGRQIWCLELAADRDRLPIRHRPGLLVQGNMHAIEFAGCAQSLFLLTHLVENHQKDKRIGNLLKTQAVYISPRIDPDGSDYILQTGHRIRNRLHIPREPNVIFPADIDGDGRIRSMRWPCPDGNLKPCPTDARLLIARQPGDTEGPFYRQTDEGHLHDWDGGPIKNSSARCDFNRNFPARWQPSHNSIGWGPYPLSEPETRAVADFVLSHTNITRVLDFHTGNPAIFHPTALIPGEVRYPEDAQLYRRIGAVGETLTGFRYLSGYDEGWRGTHTERLPGAFKEWAYEHIGALCFIVETGMHYNYLGLDELQRQKPPAERETEDGLAQLAYHDAHPDAGLFTPWKPFDHPQLGHVEIGGWDWVLWSNPPPEHMESACRKGMDFFFELARFTPQLGIEIADLTPLGENLYKIDVCIRNTGRLATSATRQGQDTHPHAKPVLTMHADGDIEIISGKAEQHLDHLPAATGSQRIGYVIRTQTKHLTIALHADRGGATSATIPLQ